MKKFFVFASALALTLSSCMTGATGTNQGTGLGSILGSVLGAATDGNTITNIIYDVIGLSALTQDYIVGTWKYDSPGCAFTSENALAKAGGHVIAAEAEEKLLPTYNSLGISSSNTYFTFNTDNTFSAKVAGKTINGTYTFNTNNSSIQLKTLLLNTTAYLTRTSNGMSLTFEAKKLLTAIQIIGAASGNSTLGTVSEISKNYDGIRLGFDLTK